MIKKKSIERLKRLNDWLQKEYEFDDKLMPGAFMILGDKNHWYRRLICKNEQYYIISCDALGYFDKHSPHTRDFSHEMNATYIISKV